MTKAIVYVTRRDLAQQVAQAYQIRKMSSAFECKLGSRFRLIATNARLISSVSDTQDLRSSKYVLKNNLYLMRHCIRVIVYEHPRWVYTRDILVVLICLILAQKVCVEVHHPYYKWPSRLLFRMLCKAKSMKIIAISDGIKQYLTSTYPINSDRILVAHDACDGIFVPADVQIFSKYNIPEYQYYIVHAGSFNEKRGADEILSMAEQNPSYAFIQVGGSDVDIASYKDKSKYIVNMFYIPNLDAAELKIILASADILLFPMNKKNKIWWCTSPMKIFDYLESGTPILGSCVGSVSEILKSEMFTEYAEQDINDANKKLRYAIQNLPRLTENAKRFSRNIRLNGTWQKRAENVLDFLGVNY